MCASPLNPCTLILGFYAAIVTVVSREWLVVGMDQQWHPFAYCKDD